MILFSFTKDDKTTLIENLKVLKFNRKDGRRIVFSKEFSLNEVEMDLDQLKTVKDSIIRNATIRISSPSHIWTKAFKEAGLEKYDAISLAGLAMVSDVIVKPSSITDTGDSTMDMEEQTAAAPIIAEINSQQESQSQGIVDDDFDVDALVSGLANTKLGGRRRGTRSTRTFTVRRGKKLRRRYSRKA